MTVLLALLRRVPLEAYAFLAILAALALSHWWAFDTGYGRAEVKSAAAIATLEARVAELESANQAARQVIAQLSKTNRELAEGRAADQEAAAKAVAELRSERDALQRELDRRRNDRGVIYERDESAAAWARARVPDAVADSLRR